MTHGKNGDGWLTKVVNVNTVAVGIEFNIMTYPQREVHDNGDTISTSLFNRHLYEMAFITEVNSIMTSWWHGSIAVSQIVEEMVLSYFFWKLSYKN